VVRVTLALTCGGAAYAETGTVKAACEAALIHRATLPAWRESDATFVAAETQATLQFADSLEELALARIRSPDKGRGSDLLLITLLNANKPDKYRPKTVIHDGHGAALVDSITKLVTATKGHRKAVTVIEGGEPPATLGPRMQGVMALDEGEGGTA
jgi:hypothetical protein